MIEPHSAQDGASAWVAKATLAPPPSEPPCGRVSSSVVSMFKLRAMQAREAYEGVVPSLQELVALSKKQALNFAVSAVGSAPHMAGVAVEKATGAEWAYIPYKGGAQAIGDTVAGQTQVLMNGMLATLPQVQAGKLKVLGVSRKGRMPLIGDVPTIAEQGVAGYESGTWQGVLLPRGTPEAVVQKLNKALITAIRAPEIRSRLAGQGAEVVTMTPAEQDQFFAKERARWANVVKAANIKLD